MIFNDSVKLKWQGKEYDCPITMELIKLMERNGVNILQNKILFEKGGIPPASLIAEMYSWLLGAGGCDATELEIYGSIMNDPDDNIDLLLAGKAAVNWLMPTKIESAERTASTVKKK